MARGGRALVRMSPCILHLAASKQLPVQPATYGEEKGRSPRSFLVLRAWAVHRAKQGDFLNVAARARFFAEEEAACREELARMPGGNAAFKTAMSLYLGA